MNYALPYLEGDNLDEYRARLERSQESVQVIAERFRDGGFTVEVPETTMTPDAYSWKKYVDKGDIFIEKEGIPRTRIEVKRLGENKHFTGRHDWIFGTKFMICSKGSYDHSNPKPAVYVICSDDLKAAALVYNSTRSEWFVETHTDRKYKHAQEFYICPSHLVRWNTL